MATHPFKDRPGWKMLIGGEFVPGGGAALEVMNPATGEVLGEAPAASETDVSNAVAAAREAYTTWRWTAPEKRGEMLFEIARRIREHHDELVDLETWENGKPRIQSVRDVTNAERTFRFYAGASDKFYGQSVYDSPTEMRKIVYEPYGVVAVIIPWNWPPMHTADFSALALATGNTVVLKPAPETPLSSLRIAELAADVLPPGVLNVVTGGVDTGVQLVAHPGIDFIAFTGSDKTGEKILAAAATRILPTMMELGGKNASILFPDADIDKAVQGMVRSAFFNSGQACSGSERVLVHETIYKTFMERFTSAVAGLVVGEGFDERSIVGPMVSRRQQEKVQGALERATAAGACIPVRSDLPRDERLEGGFWVPPTVITEAAPDAEIMTEEVFGPVAGILPFKDEDEAIAIVNAVDYGLTSGVWTHDLGVAHRMATRIEAGVVAVNRVNTGELGLPFGGYKRSGVGRKKDFLEAMRSFSRVKAIQMDLSG
ncbi:MAG: aldehyde dehydrogenase family protein [Deinococcales bacterium]